MKSMLHEASSVIKAVEKAWKDSGKPKEFTVTVLEQGEKNFLGFTKHPAVVSITYDPHRQGQRTNRPSNVQRQHPKEAQSQQKGNRVSLGDTKNRLQNNNRPLRNQAEPTQLPMTPRPVADQRKDQQEYTTWIPEWADLISGWLKEIMLPMGMGNIPFSYKIDRRVLTITFEQNLLDQAEEERILFISLSYLLIQFLKKKYKKKFRGFHLLIHSKARPHNDNQELAGA
ncbi:MAG: Jag N-terminal domain-containing protein [Candidatus Babeliales bacterium]|jgi:predicted RNA-binding protein Jag